MNWGSVKGPVILFQFLKCISWNEVVYSIWNLSVYPMLCHLSWSITLQPYHAWSPHLFILVSHISTYTLNPHLPLYHNKVGLIPPIHLKTQFHYTPFIPTQMARRIWWQDWNGELTGDDLRLTHTPPEDFSVIAFQKETAAYLKKDESRADSVQWDISYC